LLIIRLQKYVKPKERKTLLPFLFLSHLLSVYIAHIFAPYYFIQKLILPFFLKYQTFISPHHTISKPNISMTGTQPHPHFILFFFSPQEEI
jgi:predicted ATPase with chaperone activity